MASDEIVWQIINQQFCSFKIKTTKEKNFCRNEYNLTGLCNRQSCPLANSRYATVRADPVKGTLYLYMKTVERAHMPSKLWERIKLSQNYQTALKQIDDRLIYWPKFLVHKCKQRLTRLTQVAIRMRRLAKEDDRLGEKVVPKLAPKVKGREAARERKAEAAAKLERTIERELLQRLKSGAYGDQPLNASEHIWKKVLNTMELDGDGTRDKDLDEGIEDEDEDENEYEREVEDEDDGAVEYVSDVDESEDDLGDLEDWMSGSSDDEQDDDDDDSKSDDSEGEAIKKKSATGSKRKPGKVIRNPKKVPRRGEKEIENEMEYEPIAQELAF